MGTRTGAELIDDTYLRTDLVGATDRFPRTEVLRYVNMGCCALYDLLIVTRGRPYYAVKPAFPITTLGNTSRYALPPGFYQMSNLRMTGVSGYALVPFQPQDEPELRAQSTGTNWPTHYELQPGYLEILPVPMPGLVLAMDYVPVFTPLADDTSTFDGINGWEEYARDFAACEMLTKDDELPLKNSIMGDMAKMEARIRSLAPKRDRFRAERVKDVRRAGVGLRRRGGIF